MTKPQWKPPVSKYAGLIEKILQLEEGGILKLPIPGVRVTVTKKNQIRCGIGQVNAGKMLNLSIEDLPGGGLKITRKKDWQPLLKRGKG